MDQAPPTADAHGTRALYRQGCSCLPCRAANAAYVRHRTLTAWTSADRARAYLQRLEACTPSIGLHQAAKLSGISSTHLQRIRTGQQVRVKVTTETAILAIRPIAALGQRVNGYRTRDYVTRLLKEGYTEAQLVQWLGRMGRRSAIGRYVRVKHALRVRSLFDTLTAEAIS